MDKFHRLLAAYHYQLPPNLIAQRPATPRDAARLLIYKLGGKKIQFDIFKNLGNYLPKNAVLVFNQTKVFPARLTVKKPTGGKAELLYLDKERGQIKVMSDRKLALGSKLTLSGGHSFKVVGQKANFYWLKPSFSLTALPSVLSGFGQTPLPPYLRHSPLDESQRRRLYQTVFAKQGLSVAAPTASLHFTQLLLKQLRRQGIIVKFVRLDVNLGTFAPLRPDQLAKRRLHREIYHIDKATASELNKLKKQGRPIFAVGTTVVRTLETAARRGKLTKLRGQTDLFIQPGHKFRFVDGMITNFHVPQSSLLMLVAALVGQKSWKKLYQAAITQRFKFFSFGDAMLILPE